MREIISAPKISYTSQLGRQIISRFSFSIGNEKAGLLGRNGVGKSTFLNLLTGRLIVDEGTYKCEGRISYVPQIIPDKGMDELWYMREEIKSAAISSNDSIQRKLIFERIGIFHPPHY